VNSRPALLGTLNLSAGILHLAQAIVLAIMLTQLDGLRLPATLEYPTGTPGAGLPPETLAVTSVSIGIGAVVVLLLAAVMHLLVASPLLSARYIRAIEQQRNPIRWVELSTSSSIMVFLIAQLNGITNVSTLVLIYTAQSALVLFLWLQERVGTPARTLQPFVFACAIGIVPWGIIALHVVAPGASNGYDQPVWIRIITVTLLLLYFGFGVIQWLGYKGIPHGRTYVSEERAYIFLSLATKAAFAWQVAAGISAM
jgi:hypothetical protein